MSCASESTVLVLFVLSKNIFSTNNIVRQGNSFSQCNRVAYDQRCYPRGRPARRATARLRKWCCRQGCLDGASANASASSTSLISSLYFLEYLSFLCSLPFPTLDDRYVSSRAILSMSRTLEQEQQESMLTVVDAEAELQR